MKDSAACWERAIAYSLYSSSTLLVGSKEREVKWIWRGAVVMTSFSETNLSHFPWRNLVDGRGNELHKDLFSWGDGSAAFCVYSCSAVELYFLTWDIKALIILIRYTSESISISCFAHLRKILNVLLKNRFWNANFEAVIDIIYRLIGFRVLVWSG